MMNKLGILGIVIAIAFVAGIITVNPGAEGVSGWKAAVIEIEEFLGQEEISQLFLYDLVSVEDQDSCEDGQVVKRDSDLASSLTGWGCQDDDAGDEGPFDSIQLIPQKMEPVEGCTADTVGTMYFRDDSDETEPDALCICTTLEDGVGLSFSYWDLINQNTCSP